MKPTFTILRAMEDPQLFGPWFKGQSWAAWRVFLSALFGLPMNATELATYQKHTGRQSAPEAAAKEAFVIVGRRGGKSRIAALIAVFLACFKDYRDVLAPGERGTVMVIAADRRQARVVFRFIEGFLNRPMLGQMVESRTKESIELNNRITIEVHTASFRAVRGYTTVAAIADEIAFWHGDDSANPDTEILNALRPAMATIPDALLLCISSPYARRGALWNAYKDHHGKDGDPVLCWQAGTREMNPSIDERVIQAALEADEPAALAEYGARFRSDVESFIAREAVEAVVIPDRFELPPDPETYYRGFVDPSGGSIDSFAMAIAHLVDGRAVLDCVRETKPPFSPEAVVMEYVALFKTYRVRNVEGDRYAGEWPRERFRKLGVEYTPAEQTRSDIYLELLPAINSGRLELLDNKRLVSQLCSLERRTARAGRDSVDHRPGGHDDLINSAAGALVMALRSSGTGHGLIDVWAEEAKAIRRGSVNTATAVATSTAAETAVAVGVAQKAEVQDDRWFSASRPRSGGEPVFVRKPPSCPQHGENRLENKDGILRCLICSWSKRL